MAEELIWVREIEDIVMVLDYLMFLVVGHDEIPEDARHLCQRFRSRITGYNLEIHTISHKLDFKLAAHPGRLIAGLACADRSTQWQITESQTNRKPHLSIAGIVSAHHSHHTFSELLNPSVNQTRATERSFNQQTTS